MAGKGGNAALVSLGAVALRDRLASGALRAAELAEVCLAQVEAREAEIGAWAFIDPAQARAEAARLDGLRASG
ncbi:MAG: amidase, partial [Rhodobacterales bacterium CG_4_10_14_0_8_um_filter_70_9]